MIFSPKFPTHTHTHTQMESEAQPLVLLEIYKTTKSPPLFSLTKFPKSALATNHYPTSPRSSPRAQNPQVNPRQKANRHKSSPWAAFPPPPPRPGSRNPNHVLPIVIKATLLVEEMREVLTTTTTTAPSKCHDTLKHPIPKPAFPVRVPVPVPVPVQVRVRMRMPIRIRMPLLVRRFIIIASIQLSNAMSLFREPSFPR